jgi:hypothetical protein
MTASPKIKLGNGQAMLVMVKDGAVIHYGDMALPHVEFVRRRTGTLKAMPDAAAAQAAQRAMMAAGKTAAYDLINNSCVSHVYSVLKAGGADVPAPGVPGRSAQFKFIKKILNPPPTPTPKQ